MMKPALRSRLLVALALSLGLPLLPCHQAAAQGVTTQRTCGQSAFYDAAASGATQLVPPPAGNQTRTGNTIFICGYTFATAGTVNIGLVYGTGTNCGTGTTKITPAYQFIATASAIAGIVDGGSVFRGLSVPAGNNLCINTSAGVAVQAMVYFDNSPL